MKGKTLLIVAACVLVAGGIVTSSVLSTVRDNQLKDIIDEKSAASEASIADLKKSIDDTRAAVESAFKEADEAISAELEIVAAKIDDQDAALKKDILDLAAAVNQDLTDLAGQIQALATEVQNKDNVLATELQDLANRVATLESTLGSSQTVIDNLNAKIAALETKVAAGETALADKATVASVEAVQAALNLAKQELKASIDAIITQGGDYGEEIADLTAKLADLTADVEENAQAISDLQTAFDNFYGTAAVAEKSAQVKAIGIAYRNFESLVTDAQAQLTAAWATIGEPIPATVQDAVDALQNEEMRAVLFNLYNEGIAHVTLAKTADGAKVAGVEYVNQINSFVNEVDFYVAQANAIKAVLDATDLQGFEVALRTAAESITWDKAAYEALPTSAEKTEYFQVRKDKAAAVAETAVRLDTLLAQRDADIATLQASVVPTADQGKLVKLINDVCDEGALVNLLLKASTPAIPTDRDFKPETVSEVDGIFDKLDIEEQLAFYKGDKYANLVNDKAAIETMLADPTVTAYLSTNEITELQNSVGGIIEIDEYLTKVSTITAVTDDELTAAKASVDAIVAESGENVTHVKLLIQVIVDIRKEFEDVRADVDALPEKWNFTREQAYKDAINALVAAEEAVYDKTDIEHFKAIKEATKDFGVDDTKFDAYYGECVARAEELYGLAESEWGMMHNNLEARAHISTEKSTNMTDAQARYFDDLGSLNYNANSLFDYNAIDDKATLVVADKTEAAARVTEFENVRDEIIAGFDKFNDAVDAIVGLHADMKADFVNQTSAFVAANHNNRNDAEAILKSHAAGVEYSVGDTTEQWKAGDFGEIRKNNWYISLASEEVVTTVIEIPALDMYDFAKSMADFRAYFGDNGTLEDAVTVAKHLDKYHYDIAALLAVCKSEYDTKDEEYRGELKELGALDIKELFEKADASAQTFRADESIRKQLLDTLNKYLTKIAADTTSDGIKADVNAFIAAVDGLLHYEDISTSTPVYAADAAYTTLKGELEAVWTAVDPTNP